MRLRLLLLLVVLPAAAWAQRPPIVVPSSPSAVIERLPPGYAALMPAQGGQVPPLMQIERLIDTAARTGDARLAARAERLLSNFPPGSTSPNFLKARAFLAQHGHDFETALRLLSEVVGRNPRDSDARLARAQIQLVRGRIDLARADCASLALGVDSRSGLACLASVSLRLGKLEEAKAFADRWLAAPGQDADFRRYVLLIRGEAASRGDDADAESWFRQASALDPEDVRTIAAYARHLRKDRPAQALALLARSPDNDGLQLQRALAANALQSPDAPRLAMSLGRRYQTAHASGVAPEMRDEAEFLLMLRHDAEAALRLAQENFRSQRDHEDVDILRRAARAAGSTRTLDALDRWERIQGISPPERSAAK